MKVAKSAFDNYSKTLQDKPVLPLLDEDEDKEIDDSFATTFKLRTVPTDADSSKYSYKVPILSGTATPRQAIKWSERMNKVCNGLALNDPAHKHNLFLEMTSGTAKDAYDTSVRTNRMGRHNQARHAAINALVQNAGETNAAFEARRTTTWNGVPEPAISLDDVICGVNAAIASTCPYKALEKQKRFMRRKMRKPADMTTRRYVNRLLHINDNELPYLPPFRGDAQKLAADEIVDIVCFGIPKSWMRKMDEHDFDPFAAELVDVIAFCERMESSEDFQKGSDTKTVTTSSKKSKKHKSLRNNPSSDGKWCVYHESDTHNTEDCTVLKKLKSSRSDGTKDKPAFKNKTWKRQSSDAKTFTKKELTAIVEKASKAAVKAASKKKAECNAIGKRKADTSESESSDSDSEASNASLNVIEKETAAVDKKMAAVDKQLAEFEFDGDEVSC